MKIFDRLRVLPLLIIVAFIAMSIRVNGVADNAETYFNQAQAKQEEDSDSPPFPDEGEKPETIYDEVKKNPKGPKIVEEKWPDSSDIEINFSSVKMELFKDLSERRKKLDGREHGVIRREALLKAAEKELDRKYQELKSIRNEIKVLLKQQGEEEDGRIKSLVKIYEGMKAKDAARIFNTLDIDILVQVMSGMSERKVSPILAGMDADRARNITILLAEQKSLPSLPQR